MKAAILLMCALLIGAAYADNVTVGDMENPNGGPQASFVHDKLGFWDRIRLASNLANGFTIVNGALCSSSPSQEREWTATSAGYCYTNSNHAGVAFQGFETSPDWKYLGEKQLAQGKTGCFTTEIGKKYLFHQYFCDDFSKVCTDFSSVATCKDASAGGPWTDRQRTCTQNGVKTTEKVRVDWFDSNAPIKCSTTGGSTGGSGTGTGGQTGGSTGQITTCQGTWTGIAFDRNVRAGGKYEGVATFKATATGECIFSATMAGKTETKAIVDAQGSACGQPDPTVSEVRTQVKAGETFTVNFHDLEAQDDAGEYKVYVASYNGCGKDGGVETARITQPIVVDTLQSAGDNLLAPVGGYKGAIAIVVVVLVIIGSIVLLVSKR